MGQDQTNIVVPIKARKAQFSVVLSHDSACKLENLIPTCIVSNEARLKGLYCPYIGSLMRSLLKEFTKYLHSHGAESMMQDCKTYQLMSYTIVSFGSENRYLCT